MGRCDTKRSDTLGFVSGLRLGPERFQQILSEHYLEWRDVPNLDISDEYYEGQREEFGAY